jgi:hypothetical protein
MDIYCPKSTDSNDQKTSTHVYTISGAESLENPNFSVLGNTELSRIILYTVE